MKKILSLALLCLAAVSCSTVYQSPVSEIYPKLNIHETRILEPTMGKCDILPVAINLNISQERIRFVAEYDWDKKTKTEDYKIRAITEASIANSCDILIGTLVQTESFEKGSKIRLTVTGYPASYTNLHHTTQEDLVLIKTANGELVIKQDCCEK